MAHFECLVAANAAFLFLPLQQIADLLRPPVLRYDPVQHRPQHRQAHYNLIYFDYRRSVRRTMLVLARAYALVDRPNAATDAH